MRFLIPAALVITIVSLVAVPLRLRFGAPISAQNLVRLSTSLLFIAGGLSVLMTLMAIAAAAWGMDTRIPWGLDVYPYLIPALSVPAFSILFFSTTTTLSRMLWLLTIANAIAWYFGSRAERISAGWKPYPFPEAFGTVFNAFTLLLFMISILVQLAAIYKQKELRQNA